MKINGHEITLWSVSALIGRHAATAGVVLTTVWFLSEPLLAEYVEKKVADAVNQRFTMIETAISEIREDSQRQAGVNARNGVRLEILKEQSDETSRDVKEILRFLRSR